ncbi:heme-binding domain-containing protein [Pedobacter sp. ASV28]|uniref:heme-binding domain-containing protein n=1 Tax=Pedobacter sp. ASV28 TaxID=2795123 RepID=UPI0018EE36CB|nr:heme-binding domain-containing protein [Pedobacter sp. ASV28]
MKRFNSKKLLLVLVLILLGIQLFRPEKNISIAVPAQAISPTLVPMQVGTILKTSCYDCHSNNTSYPWYSHIQPIAWWLNSHIKDGKRHLNFDEFESYPIVKQKKKLGEIAATVKSEEMPLSSYTLIHRNASLSKAEQQIIVNWANHLKQAK